MREDDVNGSKSEGELKEEAFIISFLSTFRFMKLIGESSERHVFHCSGVFVRMPVRRKNASAVTLSARNYRRVCDNLSRY